MAVLPLKDAITARALGVAWDSYKQSMGIAPYLGRSKFGTNKQEGLSLKFIKGRNGLPVSLKASNFDAQAELRDAIGFSTIENEMPFFRESYMVTEKEEQEYASFMANESYATQILAQIMKKPLDLVLGALVVPERMIWQLLAPVDGIPRINVVIGEENYYVDYTADAGVEYKSKHFKDLSLDETTAWTASATATPLQDLIDIKRQFSKDTGFALARFSMNTETFEMILNAEDTKKQVLGIVAYQGGIRLDQNAVLDYLRGYGITIELYDKMYIGEDGNATYFIPTGIISAQANDVALGEFVFGTTPEMRSGSETDGTLSIVETGVSIYSYTTNHPLNTHTVVSMLGLPTFEGMDATAVIKVAEIQ